MLKAALVSLVAVASVLLLLFAIRGAAAVSVAYNTNCH